MEIERKFLVDMKKINLKDAKEVLEIKQGYILRDIDKTVRVRTSNDKSFITIKGKTNGISRKEFEYEIPLKEGKQLMSNFCNNKFIEKTRYVFKINNKKWELDIFHKKNKGLIIAEIELKNENEKIILPDFIVKEISEDKRYYNSNLLDKPLTKKKFKLNDINK